MFYVTQENPRATKFRYVGLPDYDMNKNVFEKANATGGLSYTSANQPFDIEDEEDMEDRFLNYGIPPMRVMWKLSRTTIGVNIQGKSVMDCPVVEGRERRRGLQSLKVLVLL